ncbi:MULTISPECIES: glycosyltransferase family 9 protein [unclassified Pantoea]|uniref:glycosyltransferase family 9 protein n=1 Tax=unclassified Pantoea TaxID=2630326 RepID=UPI001FA9D712|nr:glycosyltransferase family 9 protein [Pantoea sp. MQR6]
MNKIWKIRLINFFISLYSYLFDDRKKPALDNHIDFSRIAIFSTTALGDLLFNTPAIKAIKQRYPKAKIIFVTSDKNSQLINNSPWFDEVAIWDNKIKNAYALIKKLRSFKPELTVILHSYIGYDVFCAKFSGTKYIIRDNFKRDTIAFNKWIDLYSSSTDVHVIQRKLNLIEKLGCDINDTSMEFPVKIMESSVDKNKLRFGFQMGASQRMRCWPVESFAKLAVKLLSSYPQAEIVLTGARQDSLLEKELYSYLPKEFHSRVTSYIGKTNLLELIRLIKSLQVLVTGDTGPLHIAITAKTPTVSLYASANPKHTGPYQDMDIHKIIQMSSYDKDNVSQPLSKISADRVFHEISDLIK